MSGPLGRRAFCAMAAAGGTVQGAGAGRQPVAQDYVTLYESPDPARSFAYSPGIARLESGRLVATCDTGEPRALTNRTYTSDDHGRTWTLRTECAMMHARPIPAGRCVYVLGHMGDLRITRSSDGGATWSGPVKLSEGQTWHQAPCAMEYARGRVYVVMERVTNPKFHGWPVAVIAPVVMSARVDDDLTRREAWTFSNELTFENAVAQAGRPHLLGAPFFPTGDLAPKGPDRRSNAPMGWLETNVAQVRDPDHVWYDPSGHTFHLWMRSHTGTSNLACIAKAVESSDGKRIEVMLEKAPSGETMLSVPCPGGHMKFHTLYDEGTRRYWLLSSQSTDSMTRPERLPANRYNLPNNERHRLALHFSKNLVDWCFAGMVAVGAHARQSRHYASMAIDGDDLQVLSRSGDGRAKDAHNGNLITLHTVRRFRDLIY